MTSKCGVNIIMTFLDNFSCFFDTYKLLKTNFAHFPLFLNLQIAGLHMLKISGNSLYDVEIDALNGLENSLRDLELSYTELIRVPSPAFNGLQRLQILNLSGK